jgi:hypothetical protein
VDTVAAKDASESGTDSAARRDAAGRDASDGAATNFLHRGPWRARRSNTVRARAYGTRYSCRNGSAGRRGRWLSVVRINDATAASLSDRRNEREQFGRVIGWGEYREPSHRNVRASALVDARVRGGAYRLRVSPARQMKGIDIGWTDVDIPTAGADELASWIPIVAAGVFAIVVLVVYNKSVNANG